MPHGAVDHLVPAWVRGRPLGARGRGRLLGAYLGISLAGVVLWLEAPQAALGLFLAVAAAHWGSAELWWFPDARRPLGFAAARGLVPIVVPALAHPGAFAAAMGQLCSPFGAVPPDLTPDGAVRVAAAVALGLVGVAGAGRRLPEMLELAGLTAFFVFVEPVFAVGLYFMAWHLWRHVLRLTTVCPHARRRLAACQLGHAVVQILRAALPCTILALAGLGALAAALDVRVIAAEITAVALALIAALTIPHAAVVAWLDIHDRPAGESRSRAAGTGEARAALL
jgi:Brp/Blh family beta-carotene 15,15'-monooxygenase